MILNNGGQMPAFPTRFVLSFEGREICFPQFDTIKVSSADF